jgi:hypothetical protein
MSLGLKASADGLTVDLMLGATVLATLGLNGIEAGTLIAAAAEAQGLTNTKKLITPEMLGLAFKGANQLLTGNGYQRLPGGLIIQWIQTTTLGSQGALSNWPIAFPTSCLFAMVFCQNGSSPQTVSLGSKTTTTVQAYAGTVPVGIGFIGIGH